MYFTTFGIYTPGVWVMFTGVARWRWCAGGAVVVSDEGRGGWGVCSSLGRIDQSGENFFSKKHP